MVIRAETAQMGEAITQREISHLICPSKSERVVDTLQSRLAEEELRCGVAPLAKTSLQAPHADAEFGGNIGLLHKQPIGLASEPVRRHPADDGPPFRSLFVSELIQRHRTAHRLDAVGHDQLSNGFPPTRSHGYLFLKKLDFGHL